MLLVFDMPYLCVWKRKCHFWQLFHHHETSGVANDEIFIKLIFQFHFSARFAKCCWLFHRILSMEKFWYQQTRLDNADLSVITDLSKWSVGECIYWTFSIKWDKYCHIFHPLKLIPVWWHTWVSVNRVTVGLDPSHRIYDVKITSLLRQNDVATSFWRNNGVIITSCVHSVSLFCTVRCQNICRHSDD